MWELPVKYSYHGNASSVSDFSYCFSEMKLWYSLASTVHTVGENSRSERHIKLEGDEQFQLSTTTIHFSYRHVGHVSFHQL